MKRFDFRKFLIITVTCIALLPLVSCTNDDESGKPEIKIEYTLTGVNSTDVIVFKFGEAQTIATTAVNVDYLKVVTTPNAWRVTAINERIKISAPSVEVENFDVSGKIFMWAYNRTSQDSIPIELSVKIDLAAVTPVFSFNENISGSEYFKWEETKTYAYQSEYVKNLTVSNINGWTISLDEEKQTLSVKAPAKNAVGQSAIGGDVVLTATPINGESNIQLKLAAMIPVYQVSKSGLDDYKLYAVTNKELGVALFSKEYISTEEVITVLYPYSQGFSQGFVFENGGHIAYDQSNYTPGTAAVTGFTFAYDGTLLSNVSAEYLQSVTIAPYTVTDAENNVYPTVKGGSKIWTDSNLKSKKSPDGTDLTYFFPGGVEANVATQGLLYAKTVAVNGDVSTPLRGICPSGWHIPGTDEFEEVRAKPYYMYKSLGTNFGGVAINAMGNVMYTAVVGSFISTGNTYAVSPTTNPNTISLQSAGYNNYGNNLRCIKDTLPFVEN
jgi:hypothetical protein